MLSDMLKDALSGNNSLKELSASRDIMTNGTPLFKEEDIYKTSHALTRLFRKILVRMNVTHEFFEYAHKEKCKLDGLLSGSINSDKNNLRRAIIRDRITFKIFERVIIGILGFNIDDIEVTIRDLENRQRHFSLNETFDKNITESEEYVRK